MNSLALYRTLSYLKHHLLAWNTGGEGIHSPSLFYIVHYLFPKQHRYYVWDSIEERREAMLCAPKPIPITDYGTGKDSVLQVRQIARRHLESRATDELFFKLIVHLRHEMNRPLRIIELGTSLGITTAYLATAAKDNEVITFEGNEPTLEIAKLNWSKLALSNIEAIVGNIDSTLDKSRICAKEEMIDFVFMDANHQYEPTLRYFDILVQKVHNKSIIVVDDIYHSPEMHRAWQTLKKHPQVTSSIDCYAFGILFFDKHYLKRHYTIRL
ncbi:MAG: class I SAM-dependent methyltransferase [Paludibacteraceae bacterium]|nr:class I SAM-dependent methyltransferase [Paludibacteraceae bacterium]